MARVKVTNVDIYARLARGECANYRQNCCQGKTPCTVTLGEPCDYFAKYVKPLLDYTEFSDKYQREARTTIALTPNAKITRTRRNATEPRLTLDTPAKTPHDASPAPRKPAVVPVAAPRMAKTTVTPPPATTTPRQVAKAEPPPPLPAKVARAPRKRPVAPPAVELVMTPAAPTPPPHRVEPPAALPITPKPLVATPSPTKPLPTPPPQLVLVLELTPPSESPKRARKRS